MYSELEIKGVGRYWVEDAGLLPGAICEGWQVVFGDGLTIPYVLEGRFTGAIVNNMDTEFYIETKNIHGFPMIFHAKRSDLDAAAKALSYALGPREDVWIKMGSVIKARYSLGVRCSSVDFYRYYVFNDNGYTGNLHYNDTLINDSVTAEPF